MLRVQGFPPVSAPDARILILGSMPGVASLEAYRYYAHPRNAFWPIMEALLDADIPDDEHRYQRRLATLIDARIALWDVMYRCTRPGSLDSAIDAASIEVNDFAGFFAAHPGIELVACNGAVADKAYRRRVLPLLDAHWAQCPIVRLPSSSPAMASLSVQAKFELWSEALGF